MADNTLKTLIIYESYHHKNTEKIAEAMKNAMGAKLAKVDDVTLDDLADYDLIGFGSGIYFGRHHKKLLKFVETLPWQQYKAAFVFSTSGAARNHNDALIGQLERKGFIVKGDFSCTGYDTFGPLSLIGGIRKGHPDETDIKNAIAFAKSLLVQK